MGRGWLGRDCELVLDKEDFHFGMEGCDYAPISMLILDEFFDIEDVQAYSEMIMKAKLPDGGCFYPPKELMR
jgi:hypothetical protein